LPLVLQVSIFTIDFPLQHLCVHLHFGYSRGLGMECKGRRMVAG
jgi:hypothetical protein